MRQPDGVENLPAPPETSGVIHEGRRRIGRFRRELTCQAIAHEVLREQHGREARERLRLVIAQPQNLRQRKALERGIRCEISQAHFATDALRDLPAFGGGPAVAPEECRPNHLAVRVEKDRRVHLPRDANRGHARAWCRGEHASNRSDARLPPRLRILFRPSRLRRL